MQLYISQKRYNSNIITINDKSEWNHNDSHLLLIINKEEYNHSSDVKSSFRWVIRYTCLAKLVVMGNKPLSLWLQESPYSLQQSLSLLKV